MDPAGLKFGNIVTGDVVQKLLGLRPFHKDLPHMGDVEESNLFPNGHMLLRRALVPERHLESGKRDHLRPKLLVSTVESRQFHSTLL